MGPLATAAPAAAQASAPAPAPAPDAPLATAPADAAAGAASITSTAAPAALTLPALGAEPGAAPLTLPAVGPAPGGSSVTLAPGVTGAAAAPSTAPAQPLPAAPATSTKSDDLGTQILQAISPILNDLFGDDTTTSSASAAAPTTTGSNTATTSTGTTTGAAAAPSSAPQPAAADAADQLIGAVAPALLGASAQAQAGTLNLGTLSSDQVNQGTQLLASLVGGAAMAPYMPLLQNTKFTIVPDGTLPGGDAEFDAASGSVMLPVSLVMDIASSTNSILDTTKSNGNGTFNVDPTTAVKSLSYDGYSTPGAAGAAPGTDAASPTDQAHHRLSTAFALIIHESVHAQQAKDGVMAKAIQDAAAAPTQQAALEVYAREIELPAQRAQEQAQHAMGEPPATGGWLTQDANGNALSDDQATANIVAQRGTEIAATITAGGGGDASGSRFPGSRFPGSRFPGSRFPGSRFPGDNQQ
jgi:hypothetical protein